MRAAETTDPQRQAADPTASAWVTASAGTGKTKVLTDRVLNLLLRGTSPHRIVCLTFTKAAAAEMNKRIIDQLARWVALDDHELISCLTELLGRLPAQEEVSRSRHLFMTVLDVPDGMKIFTIHAFCQSILNRFPLEAGITPNFSVLDERSSMEMIKEAGNFLLSETRDNANINASIVYLSGILTEGTFQSLLKSVISEAPRLRRCLADWGGLEKTIQAVYEHLEVDKTKSFENIIIEACLDKSFDFDGLKHALKLIDKQNNKENKNLLMIKKWISASAAQRLDMFFDYASVFLFLPTSKCPEIKNGIFSKKALTHDNLISEIILKEGERLKSTIIKVNATHTATATNYLLQISSFIVGKYMDMKTDKTHLDFDDIIDFSANLLEKELNNFWVLFKLDGGIDHLLIDEAQDTSEQQWRVIRALTQEFFSASPTIKNKTIFSVGDLKQSIFSFQGASPEHFIAQKLLFQKRSKVQMAKFQDIELDVSHRSTVAILSCVDAVFARDEARNGVEFDSHLIRHTPSPQRLNDGGLVEVWPEIIGRDEAGPDPWNPPIERIDRDAPHARLASLLAQRISEMIIQHETLPSRGRPIEPGDIMVLVRRRDAFIEEFVRKCKDLNVPVCGIDRLIINDQIAVMDLIALGKFVVNQNDDLTLATVLKSPLFSFGEEEIYDLCHDRSGSVWESLKNNQNHSQKFFRAYDYLHNLLDIADYLTPHDFYSRILGPLNGNRRLLSRLGQEAEEPIAEFLELALQYQHLYPSSLQGFIHWIERSDVTVKRDLEVSERNAIRIMTVHGAKGLQAPIVVLPDTMQIPRGQGLGKLQSFYWDEGREGKMVPIWVPPKGGLIPQTAALRQRLNERRLAEYRRLLYVAMTRAEDRLVICGWRRKQQAEGCWYQLIRKGLLAAKDKLRLQEVSDPFLEAAKRRGEFDGEATVLRVESPQRARPQSSLMSTIAQDATPPPWMMIPPLPEKSCHRPLIPSRSHQTGPLFSDRESRQRDYHAKRGQIIHRLLQSLPSIEPTNRSSVVRNWLARVDLHLDPLQQQEIADVVFSVMNNPDFVELFGPDGMAEVEFAGQLDGTPILGRVDRLLVSPQEISIVDYKTDRPAPDRTTEVPAVYLRQMLVYRQALRATYPDRRIRCLLLWTDGPRLMALDDMILDRFMS